MILQAVSPERGIHKYFRSKDFNELVQNETSWNASICLRHIASPDKQLSLICNCQHPILGFAETLSRPVYAVFLDCSMKGYWWKAYINGFDALHVRRITHVITSSITAKLTCLLLASERLTLQTFVSLILFEAAHLACYQAPLRQIWYTRYHTRKFVTRVVEIKLRRSRLKLASFLL